MQDVIRMTCDVALCHTNEIWSLSRLGDLAILSISPRWIMDIAGCQPEDLRFCPISSRPHNVIWALSHPDELARDRISSRWLMADALCHPDDLAGVGISFEWVTANSLYHPDDTPIHLMSSGRLNWGWYLIRMSYGNVIMSYGWDTLPLLSHTNEIANFDFSQHAVALQRFRCNERDIGRLVCTWGGLYNGGDAREKSAKLSMQVIQ